METFDEKKPKWLKYLEWIVKILVTILTSVATCAGYASCSAM